MQHMRYNIYEAILIASNSVALYTLAASCVCVARSFTGSKIHIYRLRIKYKSRHIIKRFQSRKIESSDYQFL